MGVAQQVGQRISAAYGGHGVDVVAVDGHVHRHAVLDVSQAGHVQVGHEAGEPVAAGLEHDGCALEGAVVYHTVAEILHPVDLVVGGDELCLGRDARPQQDGQKK